MAPLSSCNANHVVFLVLLLSFSAQLHGSWGQAGNNNFVTFQNSQFNSEFLVSWETSNVLAVDEGRTLQLMLTENSGTGVSSVGQYLYGYIRASIKLIPNDSAGTVTTFYMSSAGPTHDELDFEFLGNASGQPYTLQTNVFAGGVGGREQRIGLWFDPREDFHQYSVIWNYKTISFYVDDVLIRLFQNHEASGQPYPVSQPMKVYSSIFDASSWATEGGLVKIDWTQAPFVASYSEYVLDACFWDTTLPRPECATPQAGDWWNAEHFQTIADDQLGQMNWVTTNFMQYNYCTDTLRYPIAPFECTAPYNS
jgi:xyloglucan:xyloglucosyl transferase